MLIGIDASRAVLKWRTGIEEYSYQVIKHLRDVLSPDIRVVLYVRSKISFHMSRFRFHVEKPEIDFELPPHWTVRPLWAPRFWTQLRLALEMLFHPPDALFVPAHTVPLIHPRRTIVTVHGLEYEVCPEGYGFLERLYMRASIRFACMAAERVIAVSESTKRDLIRYYHVAEEKIRVVYEGIQREEIQTASSELGQNSKSKIQDSKHFLFIGRLEVRKNIVRIIEAFERFKERTGLPHGLVLAGKPGYGYEKIKSQLSKIKYQNEIHELGYVSEAEKRELLDKAAALVFPSLAEGFGLPVLEAQLAGVPVLTSHISSLPEVSGEGAIFVDPTDVGAIARAMERLATDQALRADIIRKAIRNVDRFSWAQCARRVGLFLTAHPRRQPE